LAGFPYRLDDTEGAIVNFQSRDCHYRLDTKEEVALADLSR